MSYSPREYIKRLIKQGFTEHWIAKKANISQSTVNRIKAGEIQYPRCNTLMRIEKVYKNFNENHHA